MSDGSEEYIEFRQDETLGMITLRGDLGSTKLRSALKRAQFGPLPDQRCIVASGENLAAWMSPDELMLFCPLKDVQRRVTDLTVTLAKEHSLVEDVSDARAHFVLKGTRVREVIAKLAPVDMDPECFQQGEFRRTRFGQIAGAFWLSDVEKAHIICFRSVGDYMKEQLLRAAAKGSEIGIWD